jgi:putative Holliday junction resolvase
VLGVDYGRKRIGLALSDASGLLARPWKSIAGHTKVGRVADALEFEVSRLRAEEDGLDAVVLGWPRRLSGEATSDTATVEALASALRSRLRVPVVLQDERLSSREAEEALARTVRDWRKRKPLLDAAAAAVILQDYLDGLRSRGGEDTNP